MKFALAKEHFDFFDKQGFIEFEELISPAVAEKMKKAISVQAGHFLNVLPERLKLERPERLYAAGRDLWRIDSLLKKEVMSSNLASIASSLTKQRIVRLGLTQWIPPGMEWSDGTTLQDLVPIQGVLIAAFIALDCGVVTAEETPIFPSQKGNILWVKPEQELPLKELTQQRNQSFLMVVYSTRNSVYIHNEADSLTHTFKNLGYVYGDRLRDSLHPLLLQ